MKLIKLAILGWWFWYTPTGLYMDRVWIGPFYSISECDNERDTFIDSFGFINVAFGCTNGHR